MKGAELGKLLQRIWVLFVLLSVSRPSLAEEHKSKQFPPNEELHALTNLANANALASMQNGGPLKSWRFNWTANGTWIGGNPCKKYKGMRCWSTGNLMMLTVPPSALQGTISPALGNLTYLEKLTLVENQLSGDIASVLAGMTSMKILELEGNRFNGSLSDCVQRMHLLEKLKLARNSLAGTISTRVFTNLTNLTIVDLSQNSFSGLIPDDLVSLPALETLLLSSNSFSGRIPPSLLNSTLSTVDLSSNFLNGQLPPDWNTPNLTSLDLSGNKLWGPIPQQLLSLTTMENLSLAQNYFVGKISTDHSKKFGCNAFAGNPSLSFEDPNCRTSKAKADSSTPAALPPPAVGPIVKRKRFSKLTILALSMGDVALLLISAAGFVLFWMWWKKKDIVNQGDAKPWAAWPSASKGDYSSVDSSAVTTGVTPGGAVSRHVLPTAARSSFATKLEVKPALKSVVGMITDPSKHSMTAEISIDESFSYNDSGTNIVILDTTLTLEFDDLLNAKALVLGAGSHGLVYMACLDDGEMLAIKRIEEMALADQDAFTKQCMRLADVLHPNLLQLRAYCWSSQEKLLVFNYMRNGSVHSLLHEGTSSPDNNGVDWPKNGVDWGTRLKIAVGTARAMAHLHDSDMVHGNIKASNVLLDEQFEPRVSDFGMEGLLRRPLQKHSHLSDGYLAPELHASPTHHSTQDGDVYSLGVFLLELLTGKTPVENGMDLPTWVQEMTLASRTVQLFDPALTSMHLLPAQDVLEFLELAQACVSTDAAARPSITIVLRSLESIVPGSTAPRSYVKDDNVDSDASLRETGYNRVAPTFVIPFEDGRDHASHSRDSNDPFSPGFIRPMRVPKTREESSTDSAGIVGSPLSSIGDSYSIVSTPITSSSGSVAHSPSASVALQ